MNIKDFHKTLTKQKQTSTPTQYEKQWENGSNEIEFSHYLSDQGEEN